LKRRIHIDDNFTWRYRGVKPLRTTEVAALQLLQKYNRMVLQTLVKWQKLHEKHELDNSEKSNDYIFASERQI